MNEYTVEFTTTITVCADSEDKAVEVATRQLEDEVESDGLNQFYVYVNDKSYN